MATAVGVQALFAVFYNKPLSTDKSFANSVLGKD